MDSNSIFFIINHSAGKDEPILDHIKNIFNGSGITCYVHELKKGEKAADIAGEQIGKHNLIAVYGGDGSVTETAAALISTTMPLAIIPGGTANVLAKELGIPLDTEDALKLIREQQFQLKVIDTGIVNGRPFLLRINLGIMAEMITEADADLKEKYGQLAYGVSAIKTVSHCEQVNYKLDIDGKIENVIGVSLTVTNSGNVGVGNLQMYPGISINDGQLDVVLLKDAGFMSLIKAAGSSLFNQETDTISHWACQKVTITMPEEHTYICDDCEDKASILTIEIVPSSLTVVVPLDN